MKKIFKPVLVILTPLTYPLTFISTLWLKFVMRFGVRNKVNNAIFMKLGLLPVLDHYYQPLINPKKHLTISLRNDRILKGIDFNVEEQLGLLAKFHYNEELLAFPIEKRKEVEYFYNSSSFGFGDSEYLYNIIRHFKPGRIIEIGSGSSTLMARNAIDKNKEENSQYTCDHICIEPYEKPWLSEIDVNLIRKKVEHVDVAFFQQLEANDIFFIDSSHMIRPQGDVLYEYLEILPALKPGVIVHTHDIFTPKDYLDNWIYDSHLLWNEQYLLEAFLTFNSEYRIIGALNYLTHNYFKNLADKCPLLAKQKNPEPGSFWMVKN